eukprot:TRINITY_DN11606_c0_g1_i1.p1 TRINITY_DN11606_c0_g1~~TRINITY_DN11606_c0_g1_i1.p1  ORF type:complete len:295 (-),score=87.35 TRINITY_DN11606_c0_g1_i1:274-1158(-)
MAEQQPATFEEGFGQRRGRGGRGGRRGGRGRGRRAEGEEGEGDRRGRRRGGRRGRRDADDKQEWVPVTKLGRLVKDGKIESLEQIYTFSMPIKEFQIIDKFLPKLKDDVMKICPVQKQTAAGQRTRMKAWVVIGDENGHIGLGEKCSREVATSIRGAMILAKLSIIPVRRGYWGQKFGAPHTVPVKITGKCGSVRVHLIPAPRGTGLVAASTSKKVLSLAGIKDVFTSSKGCTRTEGNFIKATFDALARTYGYLTPDLWTPTQFYTSPYQHFSDYLKTHIKEHQSQKQGRQMQA